MPLEWGQGGGVPLWVQGENPCIVLQPIEDFLRKFFCG
jgi:hypothetical protein